MALTLFSKLRLSLTELWPYFERQTEPKILRLVLTDTLQNEVASHSAYSVQSSAQLIGVPLPRRRQTHDSAPIRGQSSVHVISLGQSETKESGKSVPQTVDTDQPKTLEEELLKRHWGQGSRFLMEQASTFDIASSLSSLHQLKKENMGLEDWVDRLIARRDHLLAAHARLLALNSLLDPRRDQKQQRVPSSATDQRLVYPVSPSPWERGGPSPWVCLLPGEASQPPLWPWSPSGVRGLGPAHLAPGHRHKRQQTERISHAQLLSVAQAQAAHHQASSSHSWQQSGTMAKGPHPNSPPKAHYSQPRK